MTIIDPISKFGGELLKVDKPSRYTGGEVGRLAHNNKSEIFKTLIAFPDLYEIGMGNNALRIIYNKMNKLGIFCDRAFAPAPDFEKMLRETKTPLYGLDTGISIASVDLLMFTLGYELGLNGILTMLDVSMIPLHCEDRNNDSDYPIIIAGGPAVSNPLPYSPFIDAFWIGEAEAGFFDLALKASKLKESGCGREALLEEIISHPNIWSNRKKSSRRAIYKSFSDDADVTLVYPVPSMKIIQNHGSVEIMRGCPNGCRFCHAGFWYRPARQKTNELIVNQVNNLISKGGWQQISLSSLSSGDFIGIDNLINTLNDQFAHKHVSFQLPSLKVSSFALSILEKISITRKSGLTFAVETPDELQQMAINKEVTSDSVVVIIDEAKKRGWKGAKFYFMIGLTDYACKINEEEEIVSFILKIAGRTKMRFNINVGLFIPKPHTPYQFKPQLDSETALEKLTFIHAKLKPFGHKVSISDTLISKIEGILSRGDERSGFLCEEAWKKGSRLDAWNEFINKNVWQEILENNFDYINLIFSGKMNPWSNIDSCVTDEYLQKELEKSDNSKRTPSCREKCSLCGVCTNEQRTENKEQCLIHPDVSNYTLTESLEEVKLPVLTSCEEAKKPESYGKPVNQEKCEVNDKPLVKTDPSVYRILFSFCKEGSAVFHGHLSLIEIFSMSLRRAGIPVFYTQGFNPLAKMEFASPLATGISANNEIGIADFKDDFNPDDFMIQLNSNLPEGIRINRAENFLIKSGEKKHSLSSLLWGFVYDSTFNEKKKDYVIANKEKIYRQERLENDCPSVFMLNRTEVLARNLIGKTSDEWDSYFNIYSYLYNN